MSAWLNKLFSGTDGPDPEEGRGSGSGTGGSTSISMPSHDETDPVINVRMIEFAELDALDGDAFVEWPDARSSAQAIRLDAIDVNSTANVYVKLSSEILSFFQSRGVAVHMIEMRHVRWAMFSIMQLNWYLEVRKTEARYAAALQRLGELDPEEANRNPNQEASDLVRAYFAHVYLIKNLNAPAMLSHLELLWRKLDGIRQSIEVLHYNTRDAQYHTSFLSHEINGRIGLWNQQRGVFVPTAQEDAPASGDHENVRDEHTLHHPAAHAVDASAFGRSPNPEKIGSANPGVPEQLQKRLTAQDSHATAAASSSSSASVSEHDTAPTAKPSAPKASPASSSSSSSFSSSNGPLPKLSRNPFAKTKKKSDDSKKE